MAAPQKVGTKVTLAPFHSPTLTRVVSVSTPFRPSGAGDVQEHAHGCTITPKFVELDSGGALPPSIRSEKGPLFSRCVCDLAIGANGVCCGQLTKNKLELSLRQEVVVIPSVSKCQEQKRSSVYG